MIAKTIFALLALPMAAAKMRGVVNNFEEELFPNRQLMGDMGGSSGGCPDPDDAPGILCQSTQDCIDAGRCSGPDCCCVSYTYPYCGVPSDCNQFLQCLPPGEPVMPAPFSTEAVNTAFTLLNRVSACLAGDGPDDSGDAASGDATPDSEDVVSSKSAKTGKRSKAVSAKAGKMSGSRKSGKLSKRSKMSSGGARSKLMDSEDY